MMTGKVIKDMVVIRALMRNAGLSENEALALIDKRLMKKRPTDAQRRAQRVAYWRQRDGK